jgi:hypothetical protein
MESFSKDGRTYRISFLKNLTDSEVNQICEIFSWYQHHGMKIETIKKVRTLVGTGLVEAKDLIDAFDNAGVDKVLSFYQKGRPPVVERIKKYRRINFGNSREFIERKECLICSQDVVDAVAVVAKSGKRMGYFCQKCYDYLVLPTTLVVSEREWGEVKRGIKGFKDFVEHFQAVGNVEMAKLEKQIDRILAGKNNT